MSGQRIVRISGDLVVSLMTTGELAAWGAVRVIDGLPKGARYVRCFDSPDVYRDLCLVFEHDDWPELGHGERIPELTIKLEAVS